MAGTDKLCTTAEPHSSRTAHYESRQYREPGRTSVPGPSFTATVGSTGIPPAACHPPLRADPFSSPARRVIGAIHHHSEPGEEASLVNTGGNVPSRAGLHSTHLRRTIHLVRPLLSMSPPPPFHAPTHSESLESPHRSWPIKKFFDRLPCFLLTLIYCRCDLVTR